MMEVAGEWSKVTSSLTVTGEKIKDTGKKNKNSGMKNVKPYETIGFQLVTINTGNKMKSESRFSAFCISKKPLQSLVDYLHFIEEETKPLGVRTLSLHCAPSQQKGLEVQIFLCVAEPIRSVCPICK